MAEASSSPRRFRHVFQRRPKSSLASIAAKDTATRGFGSVRSAHSSGAAGSPNSRWEKMPIFISRQPSIVFTLVPSDVNSTTPGASRNSATAANSVRCQSSMSAPRCWACSRIAASEIDNPQNSANRSEETSYDQPARPEQLPRGDLLDGRHGPQPPCRFIRPRRPPPGISAARRSDCSGRRSPAVHPVRTRRSGSGRNAGTRATTALRPPTSSRTGLCGRDSLSSVRTRRSAAANFFSRPCVCCCSATSTVRRTSSRPCCKASVSATANTLPSAAASHAAFNDRKFNTACSAINRSVGLNSLQIHP